MRTLLVFAVVAVLLVSATAVLAQSNKVTICHRPPGNPAGVKAISIAVDDLADHLAHGDHRWFGGFCYTVEPGDTSFATSEQACVAKFGGHLASIHSQAEDNFISMLVGSDRTARIGGYAQTGFIYGPSATYTWVDGTPWNFYNWRNTTNEPNGTGVPGSIQFWSNTRGFNSGWNDVPVADPLDYYVCKYRPRK